MVIVDPATLAVELYRGTPEGPVRVAPGADGSVRCEVLNAGLVTIGGAIRVYLGRRSGRRHHDLS